MWKTLGTDCGGITPTHRLTPPWMNWRKPHHRSSIASPDHRRRARRCPGEPSGAGRLPRPPRSSRPAGGEALRAQPRHFNSHRQKGPRRALFRWSLSGYRGRTRTSAFPTYRTSTFAASRKGPEGPFSRWSPSVCHGRAGASAFPACRKGPEGPFQTESLRSSTGP